MGYTQFGFTMMKQSRVLRRFPGPYPTRVLIASRGQVGFRYTGKPKPELLKTLRNSFFGQGGTAETLALTEFDQNGFVLNLGAGTAPTLCPFLETVFISPRALWADLSRKARIYLALDRELRVVNGQSRYVNTFWEKTQWEGAYTRMLSDCARGRINRIWFTNNEHWAICARVEDLATKALVKPQPNPVAPPGPTPPENLGGLIPMPADFLAHFVNPVTRRTLAPQHPGTTVTAAETPGVFPRMRINWLGEGLNEN
jgi:hypothetical protein